MFASAIFLVISIIAIIIMVLFRVWEIRVGRISVHEKNVPDGFFFIDRMEESADEFFGKIKESAFHALVFGVSHSIVFSRRVQKVIANEWPKISSRFTGYLKNLPHFPNLPHHSAGSSFFLKDISAHKEEVRRENGYHEN